MNYIKYLFITCLLAGNLSAQKVPESYLEQISKADSCTKMGDLVSALKFYNIAIQKNNGLATVRDRYNMSVCFANLREFDSAFYQLDKIVNGGKLSKVLILETNPAFNEMKADKRWDIIINQAKENERNR